MRKILFIILVLIGVQSQAQRLQYVNNYGMEFQRILVDTSLGLPIDTFSVPSGYNKRAWLAAKGNTLYLWDTTLLKWSAFAGGSGSGTVTSVATGYGLSGGTITTSGTLVADTAVGAGLFPWQRWLKVRDSLAVVLGLKVNVSDTATMLGNYIRDKGYGLLKTGQTLYADTTSGGVTSWVRTKKVIDSLTAVGWGPRTWQQSLITGSVLTQDNEIDGEGQLFDLSGNEIILSQHSLGGERDARIRIVPGSTVIYGQANDLGSDDNFIELFKDSIAFYPLYGKWFIDSLRTLAAGDDEMMTWNPRTGVVSHQAIPSGGGLTIGTTTISNSATKRIPYDSAGTVSSNAQFVWDFTNKRLGIGTDAPTFAIHQYENTTETTNAGIKIENAGNGDAAIHFARSTSNYTIGLDQSNSSRFYISASTALGTNNGVIVASDGKVGLNGAAPAAGVTFGAGSASAFSAPTKYTSGTLNTTAEAGANEYNGNFYDTKVNAVRFARGGTLNVNTTDVGNVGTGVDDLQSYSIPAGTLSANGDFIEYEFVITFAANANNKTVRVVYGATEVYNSTAQAQNGGTLIVEGKIIRTGATTQRVTAKISTDGTLFTDIASYTTAAETLSGAVTLKATGEATSNDDIISKILTVKFNGAN